MLQLSRRPAVLAPALALAAALAAPVCAQQDPVFRLETRRVLLHATVVDNKGHLVTNLGKDAFTVYENGKEQSLTFFQREDVPVSLGLIIDNSGSMRDKRAKVEAAALELVKASNPQDEVFIVNFNDDAFLDVPFTSDMRRMEEGLSKIDSRGGTAMRDSISMSIDYLLEKGKRDKKVLLVVTDGNDNLSTVTTLERLVAKAQQKEVLIYAIGLLNEEERSEAKRAERALKALTAASGGLAYFPERTDDVEPLALQVAHEIRNQYILEYIPNIQVLDGGFRQVRVTARGPNRPQVRTRSGYYATSEEEPRSSPPEASLR